MEVILLERVAKLGQMGEVVRVKDGFARNFLLPKGKALRATEANRSKFEGMKVDLQAKNLETKGAADKIGSKLDGKSFPVIRQASEVRFLVPEPAMDGARWSAWLRTLFTRLGS